MSTVAPSRGPQSGTQRSQRTDVRLGILVDAKEAAEAIAIALTGLTRVGQRLFVAHGVGIGGLGLRRAALV